MEYILLFHIKLSSKENQNGRKIGDLRNKNLRLLYFPNNLN